MTRRIDAALQRAGLPPLQRSAWVEVDIDILTANARALTDLAKPAALGVVVKADGYGHGLEMSARCAVSGGASWLCVADAGEALRLRQDGYRGRVFVLYPVPAAMVPVLAANDVDVTVGSLEEGRRMAESASLHPVTAHIEIDTGMTRGGVAPAEAVETARALSNGDSTRFRGIWTHLAAPEDPATTAAQMDRFAETLRALGEAGIAVDETHALASGGLLASDTEGQTFTRLGLGFYGYDPGVGSSLPAGVRGALAVRAHAVRLTTVPSGTSVGYAGTWTANRTSLIATLPLGYADGWARSSAPGSEVIVEGGRAPVIGRISSDSLTVDVTDIPGVDHDSEFTLLGSAGGESVETSQRDEITADHLAEIRGTISWEVLQQLGHRLSRIYLSGGEVVGSRAETTVALDVAGELPGYEPVVGEHRDT